MRHPGVPSAAAPLEASIARPPQGVGGVWVSRSPDSGRGVGCLSHNSQISDPLLVRKRENYGRDIVFRRSQTQIESADTHPSKASRQSKNFARHRLLANGAAVGGTQDPVGAGLLSSVDPHRTSIMVREGSDPAGEDGLEGVSEGPPPHFHHPVRGLRPSRGASRVGCSEETHAKSESVVPTR